MSTGQIQLGVKKSSGKSPDRYSTQGFFYGGGVVAPGVGTERRRGTCTRNGSPIRLRAWESRVGNPARQHLILQTICAKGSGRYTVTKMLLSQVLVDSQCKIQIQLRLTSQVLDSNQQILPAPAHLFYDIPSQKRLARCTNNIHTGATLQVWADEQRLRKGFQRQWRGSLTIIEYSRIKRISITEACFCCRPTACLESLSSAAENKAFSKKYEVKK